MRDDQTAFDYLTGALTGGARPDVVGRKFTPDGTPLSCPGFTTVCHVEPASDAFLALVQAQEALKAGPLAQAFTLMPPDSLHMTIFEGVIDYSRSPERWPRHLPLDATIEYCAGEAKTRLAAARHNAAFTVQPTGIFAGFSVSMAGATDHQDASLRETRNHLRDTLNLHRPDHDACQFHITLAYLLRWLNADEAQHVIGLFRDVADRLFQHMPEVTLGPIELCTFATMHRFERIMYLDN